MDPGASEVFREVEKQRDTIKMAAQRARHQVRKMGEAQEASINRAGAEAQRAWTDRIAAQAQEVLETLGGYDYAGRIGELTPKEFVESLRIINDIQRSNLGMDAKDDGRPSFIVNVTAPGTPVPWMSRSALEAAEKALPVLDSPAIEPAKPATAFDTTQGPLALLQGRRKTTTTQPRPAK